MTMLIGTKQRIGELIAVLAVACALLLCPPCTEAAAAAASITVPFDHLTSGFELDGVHRDLPCESCHLNAVFFGTPRDCGSCHTAGSQFNATPKTATHISSSNNCAACHDTISFRPSFHFDHAEVLGGCVSCHNGTVAQGEGPTHPQTSQNCAACHSVMTWNPAKTVDHTQIPLAVAGSCIVCHNGVEATGKPKNHVVTNLECVACHTTIDWNSTALPAGHMPNPANQACGVCHAAAPSNYAMLAANPVLHTGISGGCGQCHGGTTALIWYNNFTPKDAVLTPAHIPYLSGTDCSACHSSATYAAGTFGPMNMTQAKHAFVTTSCVTCHEARRSFYLGAANPGLQGRPTDHTSGQMVASNDCSLCHTTANWNSTALPAGHMPNPGNQACTVCHTAAPSNYATLAADPVLHTGISSGCITCHGSPAGALIFYLNFTPKSAVLSPVHIPTGTTPCEDCHSSTVFTSFSGTSMSSSKHTLMFAYIGSSCDACHNKVTPALSFYGVKNLQTRPNGHSSGNKLTEDCSHCHNPNDWGGGAQTRAAKQSATNATTATTATTTQPVVRPQIGRLPLVAATAGSAGTAVSVSQPFTHVGQTANCVSCHNGVVAAGKGAQHVVSDSNCANCHTTIAWLPARFDHRGISQRCSSCHNGVASVGRSATHIPTTLDCSSCHSTISWQPAHFAHTGTLGSCQSCHNALTGLGKPASHISTALDCAACHDTLSWSSAVAPAPPRPAKPVARPGVSGSAK